ncbi:hypothetical protein ACELLULO517_22090 [Acidisoma cellulosilytica]|uniref:DUF7673 domain-containing protein n=1 Tax=Acidisoma cellulosilyticum TaxID=2802395 RepID=A0A963Z5I1_9PROT|nr:hypothetical protein [Acidisoma cellulosilyticum]MCB8882954.1 hypothetical protein [Acidisoma cellulosilyticum]
MTVLDIDPPLAALNRLIAIAQSDTGQARRVADFLLAWWNADDCGRFDFRDLWMVDRTIADDILSVLSLIALRQSYPDAYGLGEAFERLVKDWRPQLGAPSAPHHA